MPGRKLTTRYRLFYFMMKFKDFESPTELTKWCNLHEPQNIISINYCYYGMRWYIFYID